MNEEIIVTPFDWNDNFSEVAQEDFSLIQKSLSYGTASSIGMALAKLELLEKQGCKVEKQEESEETSEVYSEYLDQVKRYIKYANDYTGGRKRGKQ